MHRIGFSGLFLRFVSGPSFGGLSFVGINQNHLSIFILHGLLGLRSYEQQEKTLFYKFEASFYFHLGLRDRNREMCSILFPSTTCPRPSTEERNISRSCKTLKYFEGSNGWLFKKAAHFFNRPSPRDTGHKLCN